MRGQGTIGRRGFSETGLRSKKFRTRAALSAAAGLCVEQLEERRMLAAALTLNPIGPTTENGHSFLNGSVSGLQPNNNFTLDINWGEPGSPNNTQTIPMVAGPSGTQIFNFNHQYLDDSVYSVDVKLTEAPLLISTNAIFVIDSSGSTATPFAGTPVGNLDGDTTPNTRLDAEVAGFEALNANLISRGLGSVAEVSIVDLSTTALQLDMDPSTAGVQLSCHPSDDKDHNGVLDVNQALKLLIPNGNTNYTDALQKVINTTGSLGYGHGQASVVFMSDGVPTSGEEGVSQANTIRTTLGDSLRAFGVGADATLPPLQALDPSAVRFTSTDTLLSVFNGTGSSGGGTDEQTTPATVINVAPNVIANGDTINENDFATVSGSFTDPGTLDAHTVTIDWADGSTPTVLNLPVGTLTYTSSHQYLDDGPSPGNGTASDTYTAQISVFDGTDTGTATAPVVVNNVSPASNLTATAINEGDSTILTGHINDPGTLDGHTITIDWADGSGAQFFFLPAGTLDYSLTHQYLNDGPTPGDGNPQFTYNIDVTTADDDGGSSFTLTPAVVTNVAPTITATGGTINENDFATVSGVITDPGTLDAHTVTLDWADGSAPSVLNIPAGTLTYSASHQYLDDGASPGNATPSDTYTVSVGVTDGDGGSGSTTAAAIVNNVAPTITASGTTISENDFANISGVITDPGTLDAHTVTIDWADGSSPLVLNLPAGTLNYFGSHLYPDDGPSPGNGTPSDTYIVKVGVTDDDGGSGSTTAPVIVNNVVPTLITATGDTIDENGIATVRGTFTDPGTLDIHTVTINWADGSPASVIVLPLGARGFSATHQYLDDGASPGNGTAFDVYNVSMTVVDDDGGSSAVRTAPVIVNNVAPTITASGSTINENSLATVSGLITDPGTLDAHTVTIDWADGSGPSVLNLPAGTLTYSAMHLYRDDGASPGNGTPSDTYTVNVGVTDDDGGSGSTTASVVVNNVAPTFTAATGDTIDENGLATIHGAFLDAGTLDVHTVTIDWADGSPISVMTLPVGARGFTATHQYLDDGASPGNGTPSDTYTVKLTVADDDGGSDSTTASVIVNNVAPTITAPGSTINENDFATVSGLITDPGTLDAHTVTINWADGSMQTVLNIPAGTLTYSASHQYLDDGASPGNGTPSDTYTVNVGVTDDDGGAGSTTASVIVNNVAPTITANGDPTLENGTTKLSGIITDPGTLDAHTVTIDWADGSPVTVLNLPAGQLAYSTEHQYLDDGASPGNGTPSDTYIVNVGVTDDDGGSGSTTTPILVTNVAPTITATGGGTINANDFATISGLITDPGTLDAHQVTLNWGDATAPTVLNLPAGTLTYSATHQYPITGGYTVNVGVSDDDGGTGSATASVTVLNVAPSITAVGGGTINENGIATVTGKITDPAGAGSHTVTINWADGSAPTVLNLPTGTLTYTSSHQYLDDGPSPGNGTPSDVYTVNVGVANSHAGVGSATVPVTVNNVAPTITSLALNCTTIDENGATVLSGVIADVGTKDAHTITINWADGSAATTLSLAAGVKTFSASHVYLNDGPAPGNNTASDNYTIGVTVKDDDGGTATGSKVITVKNVAPTATITGPASGFIGQTLTFGATIVDPGTLDAHTYAWTIVQGLTTVASGTGTTINFVPTTSCTYTVKLTVKDGDTGVGTATKNIVVSAVGLITDPGDPTKTALYVAGTSGNDKILVTSCGIGQKVTVVINGILQGTFQPTGHVIVDAGAGNDNVQVISGSFTPVPSILIGGAGNDTLTGGNGADILLGGADKDVLNGGAGRDLIIGGTGTDVLLGVSDDDILVAGSTTYDSNLTSLATIEKEWARTDKTYTQRVTDLKTGVGLSAPLIFSIAKVIDDAAIDTMTGGSGSDWFLTGAGDTLIDRIATEVLN